MKKLLFVLSLGILSIMLIGCQESMTIDISNTDIQLEVNETKDINVTTNDEKGLLFESSDSSIVSVDADGKLTGLTAGNAKITITSKTDEEVSKEINVSVVLTHYVISDDEELVIKVDEILEIDFNASGDVLLTSSDSSIFLINEQLEIVGVAEGEASLRISLISDSSIFVDISVTVTRNVMISIEDGQSEMFINQEKDLIYTASDDVTFETSNEDIITISNDGKLLAKALGQATIKVVSVYDESIYEEIFIDVLDIPTSLSITGESSLMVTENIQLVIETNPTDLYSGVIWSSSDEDIAIVDQQGLVTGISSGSVTIYAESLYDDDIDASYDIEVMNAVIVKSDSVDGDSFEYLGYTYEFNDRLFNSINDALENISENTTILLWDANYQNDLTIDVDGVMVKGLNNTVYEGTMTISANHVSVSNLTFTGDALILNNGSISGFVFENNIVETLNGNDISFINFDTVSDLNISHNTFNDFDGTAIVINNYKLGDFVIYQNLFDQMQTAIYMNAVDTYDESLTIQIERNVIENTDVAIELYNIEGISSTQYLRFNEISLFNEFAVKTNINNDLDLTLNYWGHIPELTDFENIEEAQLIGYYEDPNDMISISSYHPETPVKIIPLETSIDMILGDEAQIEFIALPIGSNRDRVKYITSDSDVLRIDVEGNLNPLTSGQATITLRLSSDFSINASVVVNITTTPGIELIPSDNTQNLTAGDILLLEATPFPYEIRNTSVLFSSSNDSIATIDTAGVITAQAPGVVTFTAKLSTDLSVETTFTLEVYNELDDNDLLDLLTQYQVSYTTPHQWIAYGTSYNYEDFKYESVSKYYFGDVIVDQSKMIPVSEGIRPGEPMDDIPDGVTSYNPYNVYWIVVHDTANTSTGAGALSHANYLWNAAYYGTVLWTSWHFSIDDEELYQHLPETERGYHAGDGSTQVLQGSTYLGGGNRNGIGIEMGVNDDADVYRTWQRTAKFVAQLLTKYDLPRDNMKYHNDFSGKDCPKTLRNAGLIPLFEEFEDIEYIVANEYSDAEITFESHDLEYLDNTGRIINMPDRAMTISYTVSVTLNGVTSSRTFYSYLPGTIH
jgi:N-acetylmuramoyl-L-alanine amidase